MLSRLTSNDTTTPQGEDIDRTLTHVAICEGFHEAPHSLASEGTVTNRFSGDISASASKKLEAATTNNLWLMGSSLSPFSLRFPNRWGSPWVSV